MPALLLYFIDEVLGRCYLAVPTWCPFRALFYFNGHNWLASKLRKASVAFELNDNALADSGDWQRAQDLSGGLMVTELPTPEADLVVLPAPPVSCTARAHVDKPSGAACDVCAAVAACDRMRAACRPPISD